jgi:hypothetical protein
MPQEKKVEGMASLLAVGVAALLAIVIAIAYHHRHKGCPPPQWHTLIEPHITAHLSVPTETF